MHDPSTAVSPLDLGTLEPDGDRWRLVFVRRLPHPPEKVWRAITEPEHQAAWFPQRMDGERRAGATLRFDAGEEHEFTGTMVAFDPPSVMELTWGEDRLRFELEPDPDPTNEGGTILRLADTFTEIGKAARDAAGWHECLDKLACDVAGERFPFEGFDRWKQVHPRYVEALGPEGSTIGPPPGMLD